MIDLLIQGSNGVFYPPVLEGIQLELTRKGAPGRVSFSVLDDGSMNFTEGNAVLLSVNGVKLFYGFIFSKSRNKENIIHVTAYDQLRYLKNKDTYVYADKTASEVIKMIAEDFRLNTGSIEDTRFKIESRIEDNKTLFDIIQSALDLTLQNTGKLYVLYDDVGRITLKNVETMKLNLLLDAAAGEDFDYSSSIDEQTYNKIKLVYNNEEAGKREVYIAQDSGKMNEWGVLQYFDTISTETNGKAKADALLSLYNTKTRTLDVKGVFGDISVKAGTAVIVSLELGDVTLQNYMVAERVTHLFRENDHTMSLSLRGGEFIA